jgi:hypothetical protein
MTPESLTHRPARREDLEALKALMDAAISENQKTFLDESQIASSRAIMGLAIPGRDPPRQRTGSLAMNPSIGKVT